MTSTEFKFAENFSGLSPVQIQGAIDSVEAMYYGALLCWSGLPEPVRTNKRTLLENYLVAWNLANMYPTQVRGIVANGGLPLSSKSIGGTSVSFETIQAQEGMEALKSNVFGLQALAMIQSAPERLAMYGT